MGGNSSTVLVSLGVDEQLTEEDKIMELYERFEVPWLLEFVLPTKGLSAPTLVRTPVKHRAFILDALITAVQHGRVFYSVVSCAANDDTDRIFVAEYAFGNINRTTTVCKNSKDWVGVQVRLLAIKKRILAYAIPLCSIGQSLVRDSPERRREVVRLWNTVYGGNCSAHESKRVCGSAVSPTARDATSPLLATQPLSSPPQAAGASSTSNDTIDAPAADAVVDDRRVQLEFSRRVRFREPLETVHVLYHDYRRLTTRPFSST